MGNVPGSYRLSKGSGHDRAKDVEELDEFEGDEGDEL